MDTLEKAMNGLERRLDGRAKRQVSQAVLTAAKRHLDLCDHDPLVNGRQKLQKQ